MLYRIAAFFAGLIIFSCTIIWCSDGPESWEQTSGAAPAPQATPQEKAEPVRNGPEIPAHRRGFADKKIIRHKGYTLSYNQLRGTPEWVAWELTDWEAEGTVPRADDFLPDPKVDEAYRVTTEDYKGSGYDRGHMAPAADMKWDSLAMAESFYMSNICPQDHSLNAGPWATLEKACRRWATQEGAIYVVCGPVYAPGKTPKLIGRQHKVAVPDGFFKCVLSLYPGQEKAIGFYYENRGGKQPMAQRALTVDSVERLTGLDFFASVPDSIEDRIEATFSLKAWERGPKESRRPTGLGELHAPCSLHMSSRLFTYKPCTLQYHVPPPMRMYVPRVRPVRMPRVRPVRIPRIPRIP